MSQAVSQHLHIATLHVVTEYRATSALAGSIGDGLECICVTCRINMNLNTLENAESACEMHSNSNIGEGSAYSINTKHIINTKIPYILSALGNNSIPIFHRFIGSELAVSSEYRCLCTDKSHPMKKENAISQGRKKERLDSNISLLLVNTAYK